MLLNKAEELVSMENLEDVAKGMASTSLTAVKHSALICKAAPVVAGLLTAGAVTSPAAPFVAAIGGVACTVAMFKDEIQALVEGDPSKAADFIGSSDFTNGQQLKTMTFYIQQTEKPKTRSDGTTKNTMHFFAGAGIKGDEGEVNPDNINDFIKELKDKFEKEVQKASQRELEGSPYGEKNIENLSEVRGQMARYVSGLKAGAMARKAKKEEPSEEEPANRDLNECSGCKDNKALLNESQMLRWKLIAGIK